MKLQSNSESSNRFPKFVYIGDTVSGKFVLLDPARATPFGPKVVLEIDSPELGRQEITCPSSLARVLVDNRKQLVPGVMLTIELVKLVPTNKGNPAKIFEVDVESIGAAPPTKHRNVKAPSPATDRGYPEELDEEGGF